MTSRIGNTPRPPTAPTDATPTTHPAAPQTPAAPAGWAPKSNDKVLFVAMNNSDAHRSTLESDALKARGTNVTVLMDAQGRRHRHHPERRRGGHHARPHHARGRDGLRADAGAARRADEEDRRRAQQRRPRRARRAGADRPAVGGRREGRPGALAPRALGPPRRLRRVRREQRQARLAHRGRAGRGDAPRRAQRRGPDDRRLLLGRREHDGEVHGACSPA